MIIDDNARMKRRFSRYSVGMRKIIVHIVFCDIKKLGIQDIIIVIILRIIK